MAHIHEKIREILDSSPHLTQKGLAERMGLNPAAVNRMLYGRRNIMAAEIPIIESYLGVRLSLDGAGDDMPCPQNGPGAPTGLAQQGAPPEAAVAPVVPVYGPALQDGPPVDWAPRHPAQAGLDGAFAVYAQDDSMAPRYFRGELVYIHPGRPARAGGDCLVVDGAGAAQLRHLVTRGADSLRLASYNPARESDVPVKDVRRLYAVVGRG